MAWTHTKTLAASCYSLPLMCKLCYHSFLLFIEFEERKRKKNNMGQNEHLNLQTVSQFTKSLFLKKRTQFLLSVSVFSLLLSHFSRLSFLHSFHFHFSAFPIQLFNHSIDKNCMFLLCNGLLVFVAKYSGLISSYSRYNRSIAAESYKTYEDDSPSTLLEKEVPVDGDQAEEHVAVEEETDINGLEDRTETEEKLAMEEEEQELEQEEEKGEEKDGGEDFNGKEEKGSETLNIDEGFSFGEEEEETEENEFPIEEEEIEYEEGNGVLSTEELNKKFDEFIRKMKEGIRIEAQQQLVMVK